MDTSALDLGVRSKAYRRSMPTLEAELTVASLANAVGVKPDTIRFYDRAGLLPAERRTASAHRRYGAAAIDRMRFIQGTQQLGLRLADIRELLVVRDTGECPCGPAADLLNRRLSQLDVEITRLTRLRDELRAFVARVPADDCPDPLPGTWRPREEVGR